MTMIKDYNPNLIKVKVEKLRLRSYIGFVDWEKEKLQDLIVSYSFKYDSKEATETDLVEYAVDYKKLNKIIIEQIEHQHFALIETVAELIYTKIQAHHPSIQDVEVQVEKPHALRFADNVMVCIDGKDRHNTAIVSLGANINAEENFNKALEHLQKLGYITQRSEFIWTEPLKFKDQPDFLNGAVLLHTPKNLSELKLNLKQIEAILGRVRSDNKNAPREMDLDVVTYNGNIIDKDWDEFPFLAEFILRLNPEIQTN